jgi:c-di-GMP-binding flagellar brake protein YcgR
MSATTLLFEKDKIVVGQPLPFSVFSSDRKLLLAEGRVVESERAREMLVRHGAYRTGAPTDYLSTYQDDSGSVDALARLRRDYGVNTGSRFVVTMAPNESHEAYSANLLGVHENVMMLTAPVKPDGSLVVVTPGQSWLCRTFQVTSAFRFRSTVLKAAFEPFPHLHLEAPKQVDCRKVRGRPRASVYVQCRLPDHAEARGAIVDLSVSGARLALDGEVRLVKDQVVRLQASFPVLDSSFNLDIQCTVVAAFGPSDARHPGIFFYGLKFDGLSELESLVLHGFVSAHLAVELNGLWNVLSAASDSAAPVLA